MARADMTAASLHTLSECTNLVEVLTPPRTDVDPSGNSGLKHARLRPLGLFIQPRRQVHGNSVLIDIFIQREVSPQLETVGVVAAEKEFTHAEISENEWAARC
jgi:hypothetical protein